MFRIAAIHKIAFYSHLREVLMSDKTDFKSSVSSESLGSSEEDSFSGDSASRQSSAPVSHRDSEIGQDKTPNDSIDNTLENMGLREAQAVELFSQGIPALIGALIAAAFLTAALWSSVSHLGILIWFSAFSLSLIPRVALGKKFQRAAPVGAAAIPWTRRFAIGTAIGALFWSAVPIFLFPADNPFHQALLTFVLGGLCVGITVANGARRESQIPFIVIVLTVLIVRFLYQGGRDSLIMGFLLMVFLAYLLGAAARMHRTITESLKLRYEKDRFIDFLDSEKSKAQNLAVDLEKEVDERRLAERALQRSRDELESRVKVRTSDLVAVNERLKREISSRIEAETALRESEENYRLHFENAHDVIYSYDPELRLMEVSPSVERVLGYTPSELIGNQVFELDVICSEDLYKAAKDARRVLSGEHIQSTVYRFTAKDGTVLVGEVSGAPIVQDGEVVGVVSVARDITDRIKAEQEVQVTGEQLRDFLENASDLIQIVDNEGRFVFTNRAWQEALGYTTEELEDLSIVDVVHPDSLSHCTGVFNRVMSGEVVNNVEAIFVSKEGKPIVVEGNANCRYKDGKSLHARGIFRDITYRKQAEEALRRAHDELEQRVKDRTRELVETNAALVESESRIKKSLTEKEILLKEIHHRVKNNLQVMSSLLALQGMYYDDQNVVRACKDSERRVWTMALVHETLYRSSDLAQIDTNQYFGRLAEDLMAAYAIDSAKVDLLMDIEPLMLEVDCAVNCGLIINELISNCLQHAFPDGGKGEIKLSLRLLGQDEIELAVRDNGVGMPVGLESGNIRSFGLDLVDMLVDELKGNIEIDRQGGTEFRIAFKREDAASGAP
jgi:PAS domain S-box-containing protein